MSSARERIYGAILRMHPAAFREAFEWEMAMDFADALEDGRARGLCLPLYCDAVSSVGRQWFFYATTAAEPVKQVAAGPNLLSGRYGAVDEDGLTAWEWLRGMTASVGLIAMLVLAPTRTGHSLIRPANPGGMRGSVAGGTRGMQEGGDGAAGERRPPTQPGMGARNASSLDLSQQPDQVAMATAAALNGVPAGIGRAVPVVYIEKPREFDVVSVKENRQGGESHSSIPIGLQGDSEKTGGVFRATNYSLAAYIAFAYKLAPYQNTAVRTQLPGWALTTRYDIEAHVDGDATKDEMRRMMQGLLADRFKLKLHTEQHEEAIFNLELVKPGKVGPSVVPHPDGDPACLLTKPQYFSPCGSVGLTPAPVAKMAGRDVTVADIAEFSGPPAGRLVIDKTGLTGRWDFTLDFMMDSTPKADTKPDEMGPTFQQAMRQQMGMKLTPGRAMVEELRVDGVERAKGN